MVRGAHGTDFAPRLEPRLDALQSRLERPDAVIEAVRGANTSLDPQQVAAWLVWQAGEWIPAPCWAVVVPDVDGRLTVLAEKGWTPELHPTAWAVAAADSGLFILQAKGLLVHLTASVGIATLPDVSGSTEELLKAADRAMYRVKDVGKDGIHVAEGNI
jgi:hypothetical protein